MKTDDLIQTLVDEAVPVRRLHSMRRRSITWVGLALLVVGLGIVLLGPRFDLVRRIRDPLFLVECGSLLVLCAVSARSAFQLSVPGEERPVSTIAGPILVFVLWFLLVLGRAWSAPVADASSFGILLGYRCIARIVALGLLPAATGFALMKRASSRKRALTGLLVSLASFSLAALGTQLSCTNDQPVHVLFWHFIPTLTVSVFGAYLGHRLLERAEWSAGAPQTRRLAP